MKKLLIFAAVAEAATGAALMVVPSLVGQLLLGVDLDGVAIPIVRVAGIGLFSLGLACWPGPAVAGMLTYSVLVTCYLLTLGIRGEWVGPLLWPAVALHTVLTLLLARAYFKARNTHRSPG
jgi:hypothetical protein